MIHGHATAVRYKIILPNIIYLQRVASYMLHVSFVHQQWLQEYRYYVAAIATAIAS